VCFISTNTSTRPDCAIRAHARRSKSGRISPRNTRIPRHVGRKFDRGTQCNEIKVSANIPRPYIVRILRPHFRYSRPSLQQPWQFRSRRQPAAAPHTSGVRGRHWRPKGPEVPCALYVVLTLLRIMPLCREMIAKCRGFSRARSESGSAAIVPFSSSRNVTEAEQALHSQKYSTTLEPLNVEPSGAIRAGSASSRKSLPSVR